MPRLRVIALLALLLLPATYAAAAPTDPLAPEMQLLNSGDYDRVSQGINALGNSGDRRAPAILRALSADTLLVTSEGEFLIQSGPADSPTYDDALTGAAVTVPDSETPSDIVVNDQQRELIDGVLSRLTLSSPDPAARLKAAEASLEQPAASTAPALAKALAAEQVPEVAQAMKLALAAAQLQGSNEATRLAAIDVLATSAEPDIHEILGRVANGDPDPKVQAAAAVAIAKIDRFLQLVQIGVNLFEGVSLSSILLLAAIGLSVTFGVMGVINMAHGEMIMLGAYTTYVVQQLFVAFLPPGWMDLYLILAVPAAFLATGLVGVILERSLIRHLYGRPLDTLLATWGVSLMLQQAVRLIFGAPNKAVANPSWMTGGFDISGGYTITWNRLVIIGFSMLVLASLGIVMRYTSFGLQMRAVTQNRRMAACMGIATDRVDALTFGLGSGIAGMAGVALSQIGNVSPNLGTIYIVDSFMVVVFGGVGSLIGTLAGSLGLGILNKVLEPRDVRAQGPVGGGVR
jgi:urea transport system permease protein